MASKRSGPKKGTRTGSTGAGKRSRATKKNITKQSANGSTQEKAAKKAPSKAKSAA